MWQSGDNVVVAVGTHEDQSRLMFGLCLSFGHLQLASECVLLIFHHVTIHEGRFHDLLLSLANTGASQWCMLSI